MTSQDASDLAAWRADLRALARMVNRIEQAATDQQRLERTAEFVRSMESLRERVYSFRDATAAAIWRAEQLSLARLAERVGVSKARADQIIREHRKTVDEGDPDE